MASEKTRDVMKAVVDRVLSANPAWSVEPNELLRLEHQCDLIDGVMSDMNKYEQGVHALEVVVDDVTYGFSFVIETESFEVSRDSKLYDLIKSGIRVFNVSALSSVVLRLIIMVDGIWIMDE